MKVNRDSFYVVRVTSGGHERFSHAVKGDNCSSINIKRDTVEDVGMFLASFVAASITKSDVIEVFELSQPVLTMQGS